MIVVKRLKVGGTRISPGISFKASSGSCVQDYTKKNRQPGIIRPKRVSLGYGARKLAMVEPSMTTRSDHWTWRAVAEIRELLSQYLYVLKDRSDKTTDDQPTVNTRMQGPIVWLGDLRNEKKTRQKS